MKYKFVFPLGLISFLTSMIVQLGFEILFDISFYNKIIALISIITFVLAIVLGEMAQKSKESTKFTMVGKILAYISVCSFLVFSPVILGIIFS